MTVTSHRIELKKRPVGMPQASDFEIGDKPVPDLGPDQVLVRTIYLSLDPYMRGRMSDAKSYSAPVELGDVVTGEAVSEVLESTSGKFRPGDIVAGMNGWQSHAVLDAQGLRKVDPSDAPISTALGVLGMPGLTAYVGLLDKGRPKAGETLVVSAATGAVGAIVGQIGKIKGLRVVGVAGAPEKCDYAVSELGFDACVSHRDPDFAARLAAACPDGVDVYYENVGGLVQKTVFPLLNVHARIPVCGLIAWYNLTQLPEGPDMTPGLMRQILTKRLTVSGFIIFDHYDRRGDFQRDVSGWIRDGSLKYREDVVEGLDNAVAAFQGLLEGRNFGKLVVKVSDDPTTP